MEKFALTLIAGKVMYDELTDEEKGWVDTLEDAASVAVFGVTVYQLWVPPPIKMAMMIPVAKFLKPISPYVIGAVAGYIVGAEIAEVLFPGEGRQQFKEFYETPTKIPEKLGFIAETIYEEKILPPMVRAAKWYVEGVDELIDAWKTAWEITKPRALW